MKRIIFICLLFTIILPLSASSFRVASLNIHYIRPGSDRMNWDKRKNSVKLVLGEIKADIIAFQEMETFEGKHFTNRNIQLDFILKHYPEYSVGATGNPKNFPITQPILYKEDKFQLLDQGFFFFSDTPETIYSRQWNGSFPYFATWIKINDKIRQEEYFVFNIHNDFSSRSNRVKTSQLIVDYINKLVLNNENIIVLGDFNEPSSFKAVKILEKANVFALETSGSTNHFNIGLNILPAIDHILISKGLRGKKIRVWRNKYNKVWPSDHYPISSDIAIIE